MKIKTEDVMIEANLAVYKIKWKDENRVYALGAVYEDQNGALMIAICCFDKPVKLKSIVNQIKWIKELS